MSCPIHYLRMAQKTIGNRKKSWKDRKQFRDYQALSVRTSENLLISMK